MMIDPDYTLSTIRELANDEETYHDQRDTVISLFLELDAYLTSGGYLPSDWTIPPLPGDMIETRKITRRSP